MKILFATDLHLKATRPSGRTDADFFATQLEKIDRLRMFAISANSDLVILGGDIFDRPDSPHSVVIGAMRAFSAFPQPVYTVCGNHDVFGYNNTTLTTSALGVLFASGALKKLDKLRLPGMYIKGLHAYDPTDWCINDTDGNDEVLILVAHKFLTTKAIPNDDFYLVSNVDAETNCGLILSGDIHQPHCVKTECGRWFVNPGSMTRMSVDDAERIPQAALITVAGYDIDVKHLSLTTQTGSEVFDKKVYAERLAGEAHTRQFVRTYVDEIVSAKGKVADIGPSLLAYAAGNDNPRMERILVSALDRAEKAVLKESDD